MVTGSEEEGESGTPGFQLSDIHRDRKYRRRDSLLGKVMNSVLDLVSLRHQWNKHGMAFSFIRSLIQSFITGHFLCARHSWMLTCWSCQSRGAFRKFFLMPNLDLLNFLPLVLFCPLRPRRSLPSFRDERSVTVVPCIASGSGNMELCRECGLL